VHHEQLQPTLQNPSELIAADGLLEAVVDDARVGVEPQRRASLSMMVNVGMMPSWESSDARTIPKTIPVPAKGPLPGTSPRCGSDRSSVHRIVLRVSGY